jgi:hypothetical protein
MAKDRKPSNGSKSKKAAKKSPAKKATPAESVAEKIATTPPPERATLTASVRTKTPSAAELYEEIRRRAYEFYQERGGQHGSHETDWHRAELEVRSKYK